MIRGPLKEKLLLTIRIHICCPWQNSHLNQKEITLFNFIMTNQKFYNSTKKLNSNVTNDILHIVFFFYGSTFESIFGGCKAKRRLELRCLSMLSFWLFMLLLLLSENHSKVKYMLFWVPYCAGLWQ